MRFLNLSFAGAAALLCLCCAASVASAAVPEFFGPTPYLSVADTPAGFATGPMTIEDAEDGVVDSRLVLPGAWHIIGPGGLTDSVDADDGAIDGSGSNGRSLHGPGSVDVEFVRPLPTSAGLVWTDALIGSSVTFEAFGPDNQSIGSIGPFTIGDNVNNGTTAEDRFFGVRADGGVLRLRITPSSGDLEIDHIQFSSQTPSMLDAVTTQVVAGGGHTCALTTNGGVTCWGLNDHGQLGDDSTTDSPTPVGVSELASDVLALAAGYAHSCALTTAGGVKCWGDNLNGQLGSNGTTERHTPVDVTGLGTGVSAIAAGGMHTCALTTAGGVKCWGSNGVGQLGNNSQTDSPTPVDVAGLDHGVLAITAGFLHTCALTTIGGMKCWGSDTSGQLGDNTATLFSLTPVDVTGLGSGVLAITGGQSHTCALTTAGGMKCWGNNLFGQLGDNSTTDRHTPVDVTGLADGVGAISAGSNHTCALTTGGGMKCWGRNTFGLLGDDSSTDRHTPVDVIGLAHGVVTIAAARSHNCATTTVGGVKCWGNNIDGQLGDNSTTVRHTPVDVVGHADGVLAIAPGDSHTCALTMGGGAKCWGDNRNGKLGDNSRTERHAPVAVTGLAGGIVAIAAGGEHTCGLTAAGGAKCWGENLRGQLGDFSHTSRLVPVDVFGLANGVLAIAAGYDHSCAVTTSGAKCWGSNFNGQLGDNSTTERSRPVDVTSLVGAVAIVAGRSYSCGLTTAGGVKCWGLNSDGQLGDNSTTNRHTAVGVSGLSGGVVAITAGDAHACALTTVGLVKCWGENSFGQLGDNSTTERHIPVEVTALGRDVLAIAAGGQHTCALTTDGVKCWGRNGNGQLGDSSTTDSPTPVDVPGFGSGVMAIAAGNKHSCALTTSGRMKCWGSNSDGQLGVDSTIDQPVPTSILTGQSMAFAPPSRIGFGTVTTLQASASGDGTVTFDTWTPAACSISGNQLTAQAPGMCGVRASQVGGSDADGGTLAAAPQQLRVIEVDFDLIFSNGFDLVGGHSQ